MHEATRAENVRLKRAAEARGLRLNKSRARILGESNRGGFQLLDPVGRAIIGHRFDATLDQVAEQIFAAPLKDRAAPGSTS